MLGAEWSLHPQVAKMIIRKWGVADHRPVRDPPQREAFLYCSLIPDPQAVFEDALRHPWKDLNVYVFPPFRLVERVVARVRETSNLSMTLVTPLWPEKTWFADLFLLLTQPPLELSPWDHLLRQPHFNRFHGGTHALNLHAWRLSSSVSKSQDFRTFETSFELAVPLRQRVHCTLVPVTMALLLWLVSWKGRYSDRHHYTCNSGLPHPLASRQGLLPVGS